jgi:hypothetical protein
MTDPPLAEHRSASDRGLGIRLGVAWLAVVLPLTILGSLYLLSQPPATITTYFFFSQDLGLLLAASLIPVLITLPSVRLSAGRARWIAGLVERRGWTLCLTAALMVGAAAFAGWWLLFQAYPLSMDEFCAAFDARIFSHGKLLAEVPAAWRPYIGALQPSFIQHTADQRYWVSPYLPMNAALRALAGTLGSQALAGPCWAATSIVTVYALGRRLWPDRKDAAVVSALLLATSAQLLFTAMTPYAMSAHLALNLVWLWLFLRKGWPWHGMAAATGFAATGLHQMLFHPLFAAPFILQLWLGRRWRLAGFYTVAYAAICLFWISYQGLLLQGQGLAPSAAAAHGAADFTHQALALLAPTPGAPGLMALNLLRFAAWQNPLAVALGVLGALYAVRGRDRVLAPLTAGMALTVAAMLVVMPFQGHGWGYRYLHGFLGGLCLLAGLAWVKLTPSGAEGGQRAWAAFGAAGAYCLMLAFPICAHQAVDWLRPYARSNAAIQSTRADVVIVDPKYLTYGFNLVRNDPFLERGPKVMDVNYLTAPQALALCAHFKVALFDRTDGAALGVATLPPMPPPAGKAEVLRSLSCATRVVAPAALATRGVHGRVSP